jgi:hypothetical protein
VFANRLDWEGVSQLEKGAARTLFSPKKFTKARETVKPAEEVPPQEVEMDVDGLNVNDVFQPEKDTGKGEIC